MVGVRKGTSESLSRYETTFLFTDSGLEDINAVFDESTAYQPSVPSRDADIIVINVSE